MGAPYNDSQAVVISNHVYGYLNSPEMAVQPSTTYHVSAWLRGEIVLRCALDAGANTEESAANWILRVYYYDASHTALSYVNVALGSTAPAILRQAQDRAGPNKAATLPPPPTPLTLRLPQGRRAHPVVPLYEQRLGGLGACPELVEGCA